MHAKQLIALVLVGAAAATPAAAAAAEPSFEPRVHRDAAESRKGARDLRGAAFGQVGTQLSLTLRTARPWSAGSRSAEAACVTLTGEGPVGQLCVSGKRPTVRFRAPGGRLRTVRGASVRRSGRTLKVQVYPRALGLAPGRLSWFVRSRCGRGCTDRVPRSGALPLEVSVYGAPRCFGAAARAVEGGCANPALRRLVTPAPADAELMPDFPCDRTRDARSYSPAVPCLFGARWAAGAPQMALIGDSHAMSFRAPTEVAAQALGSKVIGLAQAGCGFATETHPGWPEVDENCRRYVRQVLRWLDGHPSVQTVIVTASATHGYTEEGLREMWARIPASVTRIFVVVDVPRVTHRTAGCVNGVRRRRAVSEGACALPRDSKTVPPDPSREAAAGSSDPRVRLIDLTHHFCDAERCFPVLGGAYAYRDTNHMNAVFGATLGPYLLEAMGALGG